VRKIGAGLANVLCGANYCGDVALIVVS